MPGLARRPAEQTAPLAVPASRVGGANGTGGGAGVTIGGVNAGAGVDLGGGTVVNPGTGPSSSGTGIKTSSIKPDASTSTSATGQFNVTGMSAKEMARYKRRCVDILANQASYDSDLIALCQAISVRSERDNGRPKRAAIVRSRETISSLTQATARRHGRFRNLNRLKFEQCNHRCLAMRSTPRQQLAPASRQADDLAMAAAGSAGRLRRQAAGLLPPGDQPQPLFHRFEVAIIV